MGIEDRKQREKERRIQEILKAARDLFLTKGYESTTMLDIAEKAELSRRTLYHYFESKEGISYIIMLEAFNTLKTMINDTKVQSKTTGIQKLEAFQNTFLRFYQEHFDQFAFTLFLDQKISYMEEPTEDAIKCLWILNSLIAIIENTLQMGMDDGSIRKISKPKEVAVTILTMIQSTMLKIYVR
jgi:AcrR family transcriptional regulator